MSPILTQLGLGGVGGFLVGYLTKRLAKILAVVVGLIFVGVQLLAYLGIVQINYDKLVIFVKQALRVRSGFIAVMFSNVPFTVGFVGGLALASIK